MQANGYTESDEAEREQDGRQRPAIEMRPECSREQGDGCEGDENATRSQPSLWPITREDCVAQFHDATALEDCGPKGHGEPRVK